MSITRKSKSKILPPAGQMIALGAKPSTSNKAPIKREATSLSLPLTSDAKKLRLREHSNFLKSPLTKTLNSPDPFYHTSLESEQTIDVPHTELVSAVMAALKSNPVKMDRVEGLVLGSLNSLKSCKNKPDPLLTVSLIYLAKHKSLIYLKESVTDSVVSLLKKQEQTIVGLRTKNSSVAVIAANILMQAFKHEETWPLTFIKAFFEDSVGDRNWVDNEHCKEFVANLVVTFGTKKAPEFWQKELLKKPENADLAGKLASPVPTGTQAVELLKEINIEDFAPVSMNGRDTFDRFESVRGDVLKNLVTFIQDQMNKRHPGISIGESNSTRNLIKLFISASGHEEIRLLASQRLDLWLQNPKLTRLAQELLVSVCNNCGTCSPSDVDVIRNLSKLRVKPKTQLQSLYLTAIHDLLQQHRLNLECLFPIVINNEITQQRNLNNMALLDVMFRFNKVQSSVLLAGIFLNMLAKNEDCLKSLRMLFRELLKGIHFNFDFTVFCHSIMAEFTTEILRELDHSNYVRFFVGQGDLLLLTVLQSVLPVLKDSTLLCKFHSQLSKLQCDFMSWLHQTVPNQFANCISSDEFAACLNKLLCLDALESYSLKDGWPPDIDKNVILRICCESPVLTKTINTIMVMGLDRDSPLSALQSLETIDLLCRRSLGLIAIGKAGIVKLNQNNIIDLAFELSAYNYPDSIKLPKGYTPPPLAISNNFWKACLILLMIAAMNPCVVGEYAWNKFPQLRSLMEMAMTKTYTFPLDPSDTQQSLDTEMRILEREKNQILEFETHLAAASTKASINESTSLLLTQLISLNPKGPCRRLPSTSVESIKQLVHQYKIGTLLCQSRQPDFLMEMIQRQGGSCASQPWLVDLVLSSECSLDGLPNQCLCEFLLTESELHDGPRFNELVLYLQKQLNSSASEEVLLFFIRRLVVDVRTARVKAISALKSLISNSSEAGSVDSNPSSWFLSDLPRIKTFDFLLNKIVSLIRRACQIETDSRLIVTYIQFICIHTTEKKLKSTAEVILSISELIIQRSSIADVVIPQVSPTVIDCFLQFFMKIIDGEDDPPHFDSDCADQCLIRWNSKSSSMLPTIIAHASIVLLVSKRTDNGPSLDSFFTMWFPLSGSSSLLIVDEGDMPKVMPEWLQLRMLQSDRVQLIDLVMSGLETEQLVMFLQSCGLPISSTEKLLRCLDETVVQDPLSLYKAVLDKEYITHLVSVHLNRGCVHGATFHKWLLTHVSKSSGVVEDEDNELMEIAYDRTIDIPMDINVDLTDGCVDKLVDILIGGNESMPDVFSAFYRLLCSLDEPDNASAFIKRIDRDGNCSFFSNNWMQMLILGVLSKKGHSSIDLFRFWTKIEKLSLIGIAIQNRIVSDGVSDKETLEKQYYLSDLPVNVASNATNDSLISLLQNEPMFRKIYASEKYLTWCFQGLICNGLASTIATLLLKSSSPEVDRYLSDWLPVLYPELHCQHILTVNKINCKPLLLMHLLHNSNWSTLKSSILWMLEADPVSLGLSSCFDFITSCSKSPRLLQGIDTKSPSRRHKDVRLSLSVKQLKNLLCFIVEEYGSGCSLYNGEKMLTHSVGESADSTKQKITRLQMRVKLLVNQSSRCYLRCLGQYLQNRYSKHPASELILFQLYLIDPGSFPSYRCTPHGVVSAGADVLAHRLIVSLGDTENTKECEDRMYDANIALRKLCARHPVIFLRQLPLLAVLTQARITTFFGEFRRRKNFLLFTHVLGLIELAIPDIFSKTYSESTMKILSAFMDFFNAYRQLNKTIAMVINKVCLFLSNYLSHNPQLVYPFVSNYLELFQSISLVYGEIISLRQLIRDIADVELKLDALVPVAVVRCRSPINFNIFPFVAKLNVASPLEDVMSTLRDLDESSKRKVDLLGDFIPKIIWLMLSPSEDCRNKAHDLMMRYTRHCPNSTENFVDAFIDCLSSEDPSIVQSAVKNLPEFTQLCQESAKEILERAFTVSFIGKVDLYQGIKETLQLLNLETVS